MPWTFYNANGQRLSSAATNISVLDIDGATDIGAAIVDADLFIIDDGAGGTNRKTAASRIVTYVQAAGVAAHGASEHTNIAKSLFIPAMGAHNVQNFTVANAGRLHGLRAGDGDDCRGTFTTRVPADFVSFTSIKMLWQTPASSGNLVFLCYFHWAGADEADSTNAETGDSTTVATGGAEVLTYTEMGNIALSGIAAGDILGSEFRLYRNNGSDTLSNTVDVCGFEFNYVATQ
jgi:hypothetical protein